MAYLAGAKTAVGLSWKCYCYFLTMVKSFVE